MVDMSCEGCVKTVKNKLQTVNGIKSIDVDLSNQVVRIFGSSPVKIMGEALEQTGRKARLIGQGSPGDVLISVAVAEFKGPQIFGVVRLALVSMALARIEAKFSGLSPGKHGCSINEFGDLTRGAASTGKLYNPTKPLAGEKFSVTEHYKSPEVGRRSLPGVFFFYDLSPIKVTFAETHASFLHFMTNVCAIVGGIFTVAGIVDSFIYHGHIRKKMEIEKLG